MLNLFLGPGVAVMDRLRFGWKLLLVALLIAVPVLYLGWNYTSDLTAGISVPQKQRVGADVVKAAGDLMKEIQRHRGTASRVLNGDGTAKQALAEYQAGADRAAAALDLLVAQHGQGLQITEMWAGLKGEWRQLVKALSGMTAAQSLEAHTALIQQVQVLIEEVADASALNTNAVLDEFHLASLTTRTLLPLTESLGQLRATGSGVATRQLLSPDERIRLAILRAESESGLKRAKTSLELTYRSNAQVRDVLDPVAARTTTLAIGYLGMLETKLVKAEKVTVGGQIVFDEGTRAVDGVYALQDAAIAELDRLLDARIAKLQVRRVLALGLTGGTLGLAAYFLLVFAVSSIRNLRVIEAASRQMQEGDLRIGRLPVRARDEIGQVAGALSETAARLGRVIAEVTQSLDAVQSAAGRLSTSSGQAAESTRGAARSLEQLTGGVAEQAEAVDQVTRTMAELQEAIGQIALGSQDVAGQVQGTGQDLERMAQAMQDVAASAGRVRASTDEAAASARGGAGVADKTVAGMKRIEAAVGDTAGRMQDLAQASAQIGAITEAISEIAEQTNLLALNAAIEAARAGEHGKGFAVVSEEVRRLAERSARSAREIDALVGGIQVRLAEAMRAMEAGTVEVGEGARLAERSGAALREILVAVEQAAADVQAIVTAADRVKESVGQGLSAFQSVAAVTEENMASTEEMSAGAEQVGLSVERISGVSRGNLEAAGVVSGAVAGMTELSGTVAASAAELDRVAGELQRKISVLKV